MSQQLMINDSGIIAKAELDVQISTAKAYPRDVMKFLEDARMLATIDEDTAASCMYCLPPRKDKDGNLSSIKGPSIRLAEIIASCWGNFHAAVRIIGNDGKFITAEAVAWDLEKNVKISAEVKRSIVTSAGKTYSNDMQVVTGNAACSIALRNAIIKVVPRSFVDKIYAEAVKFAVGDQKTLDKKRKTLFSRFKAMGIEEKKIFDFFGKQKIEDFDLTDVEHLIGIGTAIKEGLIKVDDAFTIDFNNQEMNASDRINNLLKKKSTDDKTNNFDTNTGELIDGAPTFIDIKSQMRKAKTQDDLIVALDLSRSLGLSKDQVEQIENLYNERKQQME